MSLILGVTTKIYKEPRNCKRYRDSIYFVSSARIGLQHLLKYLKIAKDEYILLPAYIGYSSREGSGVIDSIEECGTNYIFYRVVNNDLSADIEDINKKMSLYNVFAVFVIHYFGFIQSDIIEIKKICLSNNVYLIEDCAHCFRSSLNGIYAGNFGDFSIFSIHKILPTSDGGILKINRNNVAIPIVEGREKISFAALEIYSTSDLNKISDIRVANYSYLLEKLLTMDGFTILYPSLNEGIMPMNFPIIIKDKNRFDVYKYLMNNNVHTTALYYQLIDSIHEDEYPVSHEISRKILNLPIHQDLNKDDLFYTTEKLVKAIN